MKRQFNIQYFRNGDIVKEWTWEEVRQRQTV